MHQPKYRFGLIGKKLSHSFSADYFNEKFERLGIDAHYELFELASIKELPKLLETPNLVGLNVTVPYKQDVLQYLDLVDNVAQSIGAVNTIATTPNGRAGYNTDMPAFQQSLLNFCKGEGRLLPKTAFILGSGGASKAVKVALEDLDILCQVVSRTPAPPFTVSYEDITKGFIQESELIVNTTPLGMYPDVDSKPTIPYRFVRPGTLAFDLVYNPEETAFMKAMAARGCPTRNGLEMLHLQAEGAWKIWNLL